MLLRAFGAALSLLVLTSGCATPRQPSAPRQTHAAIHAPTILISIDGFRPDYLERGVTPHLNALAEQGARAQFMRPSFPSVTFPNHYTLVTGKRPDHHGIVGNVMEDASIPGMRFTLSNRDAVTDRRWWDQAEPIWVTAEKQGVKSGTMFWPGSEADIRGVRPTYWKRFDDKLSNAARVDTLLGWLDQPPAARPRFLTLYFDEVDHEGHSFGPDSAQVTQAAAHIDQAVGRLVRGLRSRGIEANVVIVSDHGMAATSSDRVIRLDHILPAGSYRLVTGGPYAGIAAVAGEEGTVEQALLQPHPHMQCWSKAQVPARFHFGSNPRVQPFICLAKTGWRISNGAPAPSAHGGGAHGYDPETPEMRATFIATGPSIRAGVRLQSIDNVDVYSFVMRLLGLKPLPSDGEEAVLVGAVK